MRRWRVHTAVGLIVGPRVPIPWLSRAAIRVARSSPNTCTTKTEKLPNILGSDVFFTTFIAKYLDYSSWECVSGLAYGFPRLGQMI